MSYQSQSIIVLATWIALLVVLPISRVFVKRRFLESAPTIHISTASIQVNKPGSPLSKIGTLFVFVANIATFALIFTVAIYPTSIQRLDRMSIDLPPWVNVFGGLLFVFNAVWGQLVLLFNPNYTPLFQPMHDQFFSHLVEIERELCEFICAIDLHAFIKMDAISRIHLFR